MFSLAAIPPKRLPPGPIRSKLVSHIVLRGELIHHTMEAAMI
jgi:hypothetical protein